jgi:hypothetical protein
MTTFGDKKKEKAATYDLLLDTNITLLHEVSSSEKLLYQKSGMLFELILAVRKFPFNVKNKRHILTLMLFCKRR